MFSKNCLFFPIHCNPSPSCRRAHLCKRFYDILLADLFFVQPIAAQCWQKRGRKILKILWGKKTIFNLSIAKIENWYLLVPQLTEIECNQSYCIRSAAAQRTEPEVQCASCSKQDQCLFCKFLLNGGASYDSKIGRIQFLWAGSQKYQLSLLLCSVPVSAGFEIKPSIKKFTYPF